MTTTNTSVPTFNIAQTFFLDPGSVKNAPTISLTKVGIFFKSKPNANNNSSGIANPGVNLYISEVSIVNNIEVPNTSKIVAGSFVRVPYASIVVSNTAAAETSFEFDWPINVDTGKSYAIILKYDGSEAYDVWKSVEGNTLVGTNSTSAGPAGQYIGNFFEYSYTAASGNSSPTNIANTQSSSGTWNPLTGTDLKFSIYCAQFIPDVFANTVSTDPVTGEQTVNVVARKSFMLFKKPYEFITFDRFQSNNSGSLIGGELVYQNNVVRTETINVKSGNNTVTSQSANFGTIYGNGSDTKYIVIISGNDRAVRSIVSINSNNSITIDNPPPFTNTAALFSKVVAGKVDIMARTNVFGRLEDHIILNDSSANSSLRFVNNTIESVTINSGGTGYSNTDYIKVSSWGNSEPASSNATIGVVTNANGTIVSTTVLDKGVGFLGEPGYSVFKANGASSNGTGANVSFEVGATLLSSMSNAVLRDCKVINVPINNMIASAPDIENPYGTSYSFRNHFLYYSTSDGISSIVIENGGTGYSNSDTVTVSGGTGAFGTISTDSAGKIVAVRITSSGSGYGASATPAIATSGGTGADLKAVVGVVNDAVNGSINSSLVNLMERHRLAYSNVPIVLSRSYEVTQPNSSFVTSTGVTVNTNVSSAMEMIITSNNVYTTSDILSGEVDVFYEKHVINNDYTDENTGNGRALSKHISVVSSFGNNMVAEDIRVFVDAYRPANSDIKVFVRIHNNQDSEAFVDKDWTLLEMKVGSGQFSSPISQGDEKEYEFGFYSSPNSSFTSNGTASLTLSSAVVSGAGASYDTELASGDAIKIYSPLFPTNYVIDVVNAVSNSSSFTLRNAISNNNVTGSGFLVDKLSHPKQAFNNGLNSNVVRYYSENLSEFDGYDTFAVKVVFLSEDGLSIPRINNVRVVGVTA